MKKHYLIISGLIVVIGILIVSPSYSDQSDLPVIRASKIELVGNNGKVRASLKVEDNTGEVVFRLMDPDGTIRVKMGAGKDGSGFVFLNDNTDPGIHGLSNSKGSSITLQGKDGKKKLMEP